jgi:hypothetical protein
MKSVFLALVRRRALQVIVEDATLASLGAPPEEVQAEAQLRAKEEARRQQQAEKEATKKAKESAKKNEAKKDEPKKKEEPKKAEKKEDAKKNDEPKKKSEDAKKKAEEPKKSEENPAVKAESKGKGKVPSFGKKEEPKFNTQVRLPSLPPFQAPHAALLTVYPGRPDHGRRERGQSPARQRPNAYETNGRKHRNRHVRAFTLNIGISFAIYVSQPVQLPQARHACRPRA